MTITGKRIGYTRVSTHDQSLARQLEGVEIDKMYCDRASGRDTQRPQLAAMLSYAREGDIIFVHSLDRLARNLRDLTRMVEDLASRGVRIKFIKENLEFCGDESPMSVLLLHIFGALAQFERSLIRERQAEGIAIAKRNGVYLGRSHKLTREEVMWARERVRLGVPKAKIARDLTISRSSLHTYLKLTCLDALQSNSLDKRV